MYRWEQSKKKRKKREEENEEQAKICNDTSIKNWVEKSKGQYI